MVEDFLKQPYTYLLQAMMYAKAAVENGGKVNMIDVPDIMDMGYGEGEMFYNEFLTRFGEVDDWGINDEECDPEKFQPVYFTANERGMELGKIAIEIEHQFADCLIPTETMKATIAYIEEDMRKMLENEK